jgi:4-hydroxy-3-methylbut-2-enyl diphosphate reductase
MKFFILKFLVFFCFPSKKEKKETHPKSKTHQNTTIGYCWGVERAVQMAYEARRQWPGAKMHVTNEIIHNPAVNKRLQEMDIAIIQDVEGSGKDFTNVQPSDVVILPAFGASVQEMKLLADRGVQIVDTTCPWVAKVWNAVDGQARKAHTSVIHGKYSHEETVATASFAETYLIVRDLEEARYVCDYITQGGDRAEFLAKFSRAVSAGFDPDRDLEKIGLANQTTMLRDETLEIGKMLERAQLQRHGADRLKDTYMVMDTICDATQERQDAVHSLVDAKPDMVLVVGGFNSSNTSHLQEIPEGEDVPSFWVDGVRCVDVLANSITHKTAAGEMVTTAPWLPTDGRPFTLGVTSGASTPDRAVEEVLEAAFAIVDPGFKGIAPDLSLAGTTSRPEGQH